MLYFSLHCGIKHQEFIEWDYIVLCGCLFKVYSISLNLWSVFNNTVTQKHLLLTLQSIPDRPPAIERQRLAVNVELSVFMRPLKTHRSRPCLWAPCQACMFGFISNYTDRSCTSSCWKTAVTVAGWASLHSPQLCEYRRTVINDASSPSCSPADHSQRLLYPDVWQLHAAHVLLRLLTRLHLGELVL